MSDTGKLRPGAPRSSGAIPQRRIPQDWPKDRRFRILSVDGGGIRGIFPAAILAALERSYTAGRPISSYFDLAAGTSTGGILALGLGAGVSAQKLLDLYVKRGCEVFPPAGRLRSILRDLWHYAEHLYDRSALEIILQDVLKERLFGDSILRLCIPAFEGTHSEVFVFKTPHHRDYREDRYQRMVTVALATAAAPSFFRPLPDRGYTLVDGGVWANNPIMLAVIEALICFRIDPSQIDVLSLGCGDDPYVVSPAQKKLGGLWDWKNIIEAAMRLQSLAATNQARLLLGPPSVIRLDAPAFTPKIRMDDWARSVSELMPAAADVVVQHGSRIASTFFSEPAAPYIPHPAPQTSK